MVGQLRPDVDRRGAAAAAATATASARASRSSSASRPTRSASRRRPTRASARSAAAKGSRRFAVVLLAGRGAEPWQRIYGFHPVREALRHRPHEVARVWSRAAAAARGAREIEELCREHGVRVDVLDDGVGASPARRAVHNGFAAELRARGRRRRRARRPRLRRPGRGRPGPAQPRRPAAGLRGRRSRAGAGARPRLGAAHAGGRQDLGRRQRVAEVERISNSAQALEAAEGGGLSGSTAPRGGGRRAVGRRPDGQGRALPRRRGEGPAPLTRELCDRLVGLPMRGRVESLNLATAAAAILYEAVRQRRAEVTPSSLARKLPARLRRSGRAELRPALGRRGRGPRRHSSAVEHPPCKRKVPGSIPGAGSTGSRRGSLRSRRCGRAVNGSRL